MGHGYGGRRALGFGNHFGDQRRNGTGEGGIGEGIRWKGNAQLECEPLSSVAGRESQKLTMRQMPRGGKLGNGNLLLTSRGVAKTTGL